MAKSGAASTLLLGTKLDAIFGYTYPCTYRVVVDYPNNLSF